jgi:hypothetical protein
MTAQLSKQARNLGNTSKQQGSYDALTAIERILGQLYHRRNSLLASFTGMTTPIGPTAKSEQPPVPVTRTILELERSIERLETMKNWLTEDPQLLALIDAVINQRVRAMERRSKRSNIEMALVTTIGGALIGWLLAAISSPHDFLRLLGL